MRRTELQSRIKRLEAVAGKGRRFCPLCRLENRSRLPDPKKPRVQVDEVVKTQCPMCQTEYLIGLTGLTETEREIFRLILSSTFEDLYTNPKAHAAVLWIYYHPHGKDVAPDRTFEETYRALEVKAKKNRNARLYIESINEVRKRLARKQKILAAKYGEFPFREQKLLIREIGMRQKRSRDKSMYVLGLFDLEMEETRHLIRAELEKIICGLVSPETASAIEDVRRRIGEVIKVALEEKQRREDERLSRERESLQSTNQDDGAMAEASGRVVAAPGESLETGEPESGNKTPPDSEKKGMSILRLRILKAMEKRNRIQLPKR